jgi:hypothetical protein
VDHGWRDTYGVPSTESLSPRYLHPTPLSLPTGIHLQAASAEHPPDVFDFYFAPTVQPLPVGSRIPTPTVTPTFASGGGQAQESQTIFSDPADLAHLPIDFVNSKSAQHPNLHNPKPTRNLRLNARQVQRSHFGIPMATGRWTSTPGPVTYTTSHSDHPLTKLSRLSLKLSTPQPKPKIPKSHLLRINQQGGRPQNRPPQNHETHSPPGKLLL